MDRRKIENAALVLPFIGAIMIVPPVLSVFEIHLRVFGIPLEVLYLFVVWLGLIGVAALLARRLRAAPKTAEEPVRDDIGGPQ